MLGIIVIYILIGMLINTGYMHVIFKGFKQYNITSKSMQYLYVLILVLIWPLFVYYLIRNHFK